MKFQDYKKLRAFITNISFFTILMIPTTSINAQNITFKFKGVVTNVDQKIHRHRDGGSIQTPRPQEGFSPGDKFSGAYTFNPNTPAQPPGDENQQYIGTISAMTLNSQTNTMAAAKGNVLLNTNSDNLHYTATFSRFSGGSIDNNIDAFEPEPTIYNPIEMTLNWVMVDNAGASLVWSLPSSAGPPRNPNYHSNFVWGDLNDYGLPAPNYGNFHLTYKNSDNTVASIKGKLYSVTRVPRFFIPGLTDDDRFDLGNLWTFPR